MKIKVAAILFYISFNMSFAALIKVNPTNYINYLSQLRAGDTLFLENGNYLNQLNIINLNGMPDNPIVISGESMASVIFKGNACCNTISIKMSSYIIIKNFTIDGQGIAGIDGIKAEGTSGNWAHHITIEKIKIIGHGGDQQTDGISTKCPAWDWVIRRCIIDGAGTGLYLGNSDGTDPFVNGVIEGNLVTNSVGYCMEIKHQDDGLRTVPGMTLNGKTILRNNVFCKGSNSSSEGNERPNVLLGGFPSVGDGSSDYYEVYKNFFYNNPYEGLFQATGNIILYNNIFVNHNTGWGVQIREHEGSKPRNIKIFHNTIVVANGTGLNFYNNDETYTQIGSSNAIFATTPINYNTSITLADNVTDNYVNSTKYLESPLSSPSDLKVQPIYGQLTGSISPSSEFQSYLEWDKDFSGNAYDWTYRGAYSSPELPNDWKLNCDTMNIAEAIITKINNFSELNKVNILPNPVDELMRVSFISNEEDVEKMSLIDITGREYVLPRSQIKREVVNGIKVLYMNTKNIPTGIYILFLNSIISKKVIVQH